MKVRIFFFITLSCVSFNNCNTTIKEEQIITENSTVTVEDTVSLSMFDDFLAKFSIDTTFQINSIEFPLEVKLEDFEIDTIVYLSNREWHFINLADATKFPEKVMFKHIAKKDTIKVIAIGIDTGVNIIYRFEKRNEIWKLIAIHDSSD